MITKEVFFGGAVYNTLTGNINIHPGEARIHRIDPNGAGRVVTLPDARILRPGFPILIVSNESATDTFQINDNSGSAVVTVSTNRLVSLALLTNTTQAGEWFANQVRVGGSVVASVLQYDGYIHGGTGGSGKDTIYLYDISGDSWASMDTSPTEREWGAGFALNKFGYYIGDSPTSGGVSDTLDRYSRTDDSWVNLATCAYEPEKNVAGGVKGKGYSISGEGVVDNQEFDPVTNSWSAKTSIGYERSEACSDDRSDRILIFSGLPANTTNIYYHPESDSYVDFSNYSIDNRYAMSCFRMDGKAHIIGGYDGTSYYDDVGEYDHELDTYSTKTVLSSGDRYRAAGLTGVSDSFHCGGLDSGGTGQSGVVGYDSTDSWTSKTPMTSIKSKISNMGVSLQ